jgi:hypothetical protein
MKDTLKGLGVRTIVRVLRDLNGGTVGFNYCLLNKKQLIAFMLGSENGKRRYSDTQLSASVMRASGKQHAKRHNKRAARAKPSLLARHVRGTFEEYAFQAIAAPCPDCKAHAGSPCKRPSGHATADLHSARKRLADEQFTKLYGEDAVISFDDKANRWGVREKPRGKFIAHAALTGRKPKAKRNAKKIDSAPLLATQPATKTITAPPPAPKRKATRVSTKRFATKHTTAAKTTFTCVDGPFKGSVIALTDGDDSHTAWVEVRGEIGRYKPAPNKRHCVTWEAA